jgi:hypothetical protein
MSATCTIIISSILAIVFPAGMIFLLQISAHFAFLVLGGLFLVLRFTAFTLRESLLYILIGTVNTFLGVLSLILFISGKVNQGMPENMSINLLLGVVMLIDALLLKRKTYEQSS